MPSNLISELAQTLGGLLKQKGHKVCTAESCTGGGVAEAITRVAGSSAWFEAGFVTYSNGQKSAQLGVPEALFASVGAVSAEVVEAMAEGARQKACADYAVAVSGIAGPDGGTAQKPVGTVWLAWSDGVQTLTECAYFRGDRQSVREQTVIRALQGLITLSASETR